MTGDEHAEGKRRLRTFRMEDKEMGLLDNFFNRLAGRRGMDSVSVRVDDSPGWLSVTGRAHDYDPGTVQELYQDALTAWRKNPIAWRIVAIVTDYVVGDQLTITSNNRQLQRFIAEFWHHPQNRMDLRLEALNDELSRSGDLFILLFRNSQDGMSYLRLVTKDRIQKIVSAANDWETELEYHEVQELGDPKVWLSPANPAAAESDAIMLHYSVNRPAGALMGESDLTTMLPWLQRYSRMLEDRVRLHWAVRAFLWVVTVPSTKVQEKREQYRNPPEAGSIVVKDESEIWEVASPTLHGADAQHDLKAVRGMIDAGSGFPPHWRGEAADANLATATAMQGPTERHLLRRQKYFVFLLEDILFHAYQRARELGYTRALATSDYNKLFVASVQDVSRTDNEALARSAKDFTQALSQLGATLSGKNESYKRLALREAMRFAGSPLTEEEIDQVVQDGAVEERPTTEDRRPPTDDR